MTTKNFFGLLLGAMALSAIAASCQKDDTPADNSYIITFENAQLGEQGYANTQNYTEQDVTFECNYDAAFSSHNGFAISRLTDRSTPGYGNQHSVYAAQGAGGSNNFAVYFPWEGDQPSICLPKDVEHQVVSAYFCLTTYTYLAIVNGDDGYGAARKFELAQKDHFDVTAIGFDRANKEVGRLTFSMADYRGEQPVLFDDWRLVDLSALGRVNRILFEISSTDVGAYGPNTPTYFAIDNLKLDPATGH